MPVLHFDSKNKDETMKILIVFTILAVTLTAASPTSRIVNGEEAQVGQFPYQVLVHPEFPQGKALCGGVCEFFLKIFINIQSMIM